MKRGGPLKRTAPLRSSSQLARTPLRPRSRKRAELYRTERVPLVVELLAEHPTCQRCHAARSVDVHEPLLRSRGGNPYDITQCVALCRRCHDWIHQHPQQATAAGWMRNSWERTA